MKLGSIKLKNRMVMAPMTRSRADHDGIVNDLIKRYYVQRASAGLIISEGINISEQAKGNPFTAGLYNKKQINAWKDVTKAVHKEGGVIYAQLGHTGRVGHSVDMITHATLFLANPDLPKRFETGAQLNEPESETFYAGAERGYTDYPFLE